jgi:hypothetical protein
MQIFRISAAASSRITHFPNLLTRPLTIVGNLLDYKANTKFKYVDCVIINLKIGSLDAIMWLKSTEKMHSATNHGYFN